MRKAVMIVGVVVGLVIVVIAAVLIYAARNLNSIIAERQPYLLQRLSDSLGRKVEVASIKATLGWGLVAELTGVKIQDDPALSDRPFLEASDAYAKVDLLPLLSRHIHVTEVTLNNPVVRVIRTEQGGLNVSTIGKGAREEEEKPSENSPEGGIQGAPITSERGSAVARRKAAAESLGALYVKSLLIDNGMIVYEERGTNHQTVTISAADLAVKDFSFTRAFDLSLKLAMLSDKQNVDISGTMGPLATRGILDVKNAHFAIEAKIGPLDLAKLRAIGSLGKAIPGALSVPDPVSSEATADGTPSALKFHFETDLTADRVAWAASFNKPASVPLKLSADGSRSDTALVVAQVNLKLGDLDANLRDIKFDDGDLSARVDTNRFDIASMVKVLPALQKYDASGHAEIHAEGQVANQQPRAKGTISLADVALSRPDAKKALINNLNGDIKLKGEAAEVGPMKFDLGDGHATGTLGISSLRPFKATYNFSIDRIKPGDLVPDRPDGEFLSTVLATGTITQTDPLPALPSLTTNASVAEGNLANAGFKDLIVAMTMAGQQVDIQSFKVAVFNGNVAGNGTVLLEKVPQFSLNLDAKNVDVQQALLVQDPKSAAMFRGNVDAQFEVSGRGAKFDDIKPTLKGGGRAAVRDGKLVGANLIVLTLAKTKGIPEIGDLIPPGIVKRHPELFSNPDTDIDRAGLTFTLAGIRINTSDLVVQAEDYGMSAAGWFDMDRNVDLSGHALLTRKFSQEIVGEKHNVVYLTNQDGEVDIPLRIEGRLPKPNVTPDLAVLIQHAASHALEQNLGKLLGKKGKGLNIPFLPNGGGGTGSGNGKQKPSDNPLDQLKGLFH